MTETTEIPLSQITLASQVSLWLQQNPQDPDHLDLVRNRLREGADAVMKSRWLAVGNAPGLTAQLEELGIEFDTRDGQVHVHQKDFTGAFAVQARLEPIAGDAAHIECLQEHAEQVLQAQRRQALLSARQNLPTEL